MLSRQAIVDMFTRPAMLIDGRRSLHATNRAATKRDEALDVHRELVDALRLRDGARAEACSRSILDLAARDLSGLMGGARET